MAATRHSFGIRAIFAVIAFLATGFVLGATDLGRIVIPSDRPNYPILATDTHSDLQGTRLARTFLLDAGEGSYLVAITVANVNEYGLPDLSHRFEARSQLDDLPVRLPLDDGGVLVAVPEGGYWGMEDLLLKIE